MFRKLNFRKKASRTGCKANPTDFIPVGDIPLGCRELTDEETFKVNGGSKEETGEKKDSTKSTVTVNKNDTLGKVVSDYNNEHGTNFTVGQIAELNGISNPDVIHPGQEISFSFNTPQSAPTTGPTSTPTPSISMTQESPASGVTPSKPVAATASSSMGSVSVGSVNENPGTTVVKSSSGAGAGNQLASSTLHIGAGINTGANYSTSTVNSTNFESSIYKEKYERYVAQASKNGIGGNTIKGNNINGMKPEATNISKANDVTIPTQIHNKEYAENLKKSNGTYYNSISKANTPVNTMEANHAKAIRESIKHMYFDESRVKSTRVEVFRQTDGLGNSFDSDRYVYKSDGVREFIVYRDKVGANCSSENSSDADCFTEPDGEYHYTTNGLIKQLDGTYDSKSYKNVLRHTTDDPNIPKEIRDKINISPADFLEHPNQKKNASTPYSTIYPQSAGCTITQGGQAQHDKFMEYLYMGTNDLSSVEKCIYSYKHDQTYNPLD